MYKLLCYYACLFGIRIFQLIQLYFSATPTGNVLVERPLAVIFCASLTEASVFAIILLCGLPFFIKKQTRSIGEWFYFSIGIFYLTLSAINDQIMRWMGAHLDISFLKTYSVFRMESELVKKIAFDGLFNFLLSIAFITIAIVALILIRKKILWKNPRLSIAIITSILFIGLLVTGLLAPTSFKPCKIRWQRTQPVVVSLYKSFSYEWGRKEKPLNFDEGIHFLGGNPEQEYPFFHYVANEDSLLAQFKQKPIQEKPDIILLSIESLRGWAADFRIQENCDRMPNLCALAKRSIVYPYTYSVGYPSTEGMTGLQLGIWSHPYKTILMHLVSGATLSLPEILGKAGYYRFFLTAAEPSFDNFTPWFEKWSDAYEYNPANHSDLPLAHRFAEWYKSRPKDRPLYCNWLNFSTHIPFTVPESFAKPAANSTQRYAQALAYLDSALSIVFSTINSDERASKTILVVTGDHSIANKGNSFASHTWTTMIWNTPGMQPVLITKPVSHVDFAPTILKILGLNVSNHFVGSPLLDSYLNPLEDPKGIQSYWQGNFAFRKDSLIITGHIESDNPVQYAFHSGKVDWDTTDVIGGFEEEPNLTPLQAKTSMAANLDLPKDLRAAAQAWVYLLDKNKLFPPTASK